MTLEQFRTITRDLSGALTVEIVVNDTHGGEHTVYTMTTVDGALLLCSDNAYVSTRETVLYDHTPEPRMD
jgi:hypothetical protein